MKRELLLCLCLLFTSFYLQAQTLSMTSPVIGTSDDIFVSWVDGPTSSSFSWIGLFDATETDFTNYQSGYWEYTNGNATGSLTLPAYSLEGDYILVFFQDSGYTEVARIAFTISDTVLSVTEFDTQVQLSMYPNPVVDQLTIRADQSISNISIANTLGQVVYVSNTITTEKTIDFSTFNSGIYMVSITTEFGTKTERIIK